MVSMVLRLFDFTYNLVRRLWLHKHKVKDVWLVIGWFKAYNIILGMCMRQWTPAGIAIFSNQKYNNSSWHIWSFHVCYFNSYLEEKKIRTFHLWDNFCVELHVYLSLTNEERGVLIHFVWCLSNLDYKQGGDGWFLDSTNQSLGFILADHGFDVWVGNVRGTRWSHGHVSMSEKDKVDKPSCYASFPHKNTLSILNYIRPFYCLFSTIFSTEYPPNTKKKEKKRQKIERKKNWMPQCCY